MKTAALLVVLGLVGCSGSAVEQRRQLVISVDGVSETDALAACNVWAEFVDCTTVGEPNTRVAVGASDAADGQDVYAVTTLTSITIDTAWLARDGVPLVFALSHEFGHRLGIIDHIPGPALMARDAAGTWLRAELSDADRDAAARAQAVSLVGLQIVR